MLYHYTNSNRTDTIPVITLIYSNRTVINLVADIYILRIVLTDHGLVPKIMHGPPTHFHLSTSMTEYTQ